MDIKFRAYIPNLQWMVPVARINFDVETIEYDLSDGNGDLDECGFDAVEIMQYTGFKALEEEIFDGDILQITIDDSVEPISDIGIVRMSKYSGGWSVEDKHGNFIDRLYEWVCEGVRIAGNVFENQELMNND